MLSVSSNKDILFLGQNPIFIHWKNPYLLNFRMNMHRIVWYLQLWFDVMNEKLITSTLTHFFLCLHHLILPADPAKPIQKAALWKIFDIFKYFVPSSLIIYSLSLLAGCSKKRGNRKLDMTTQSNRHSLSFLTLSLFGVFFLDKCKNV